MIGCPTGAIHREPDSGLAVITDETCIGCGTCANSCPYQNIRMVEIRNSGGELYRDAQTLLPIAKATKCDLCVGQLGGPACQRACPHDALVRIDLSDVEKVAQWTKP
jgi:Fe-S-cluster-containing hydrogenase component 2